MGSLLFTEDYLTEDVLIENKRPNYVEKLTHQRRFN